MDFSKLKTSDWLKVGGAAGMLLFGLFNWAKAGPYSGGNAFDWFLTGGVSWLLLGAVAVVTVLLAGGQMSSKSLPWPLIILAATALAALLMILRFIVGVDPYDRGIGLIVSTIAAIVAAVGGFLGFKESGGDLNDLTDIDKIKGAFAGDSGSTPPPPPPPPGGMPPPPPPPAN